MTSSQQGVVLKGKELASTTKARPERLYQTSWYAKSIKNWWLVDILVCVAAVIILWNLKKYDGKQAPRANTLFGANITLNTLVSVLITISRAALLLSVCECVSQSKWF